MLVHLHNVLLQLKHTKVAFLCLPSPGARHLCFCADFQFIEVPVLLPGVLEDGRLAKQTAGSFRRVAAGKVAGVQALERQLSNAPTRGVVAFSSVSSIVAPLGQPNYASANASLCAWASAKAAQGEACNQEPCSRVCGLESLSLVVGEQARW